ncbi:MAG: methionine--tRNA ligase subunit beta [bacterium]
MADEGTITIQEYGRIDMRVGEIKTAAVVEGADKLYRIEVDIGGEIRQTVAGIRQWYDAGALVGRKVVFLANLQPTKIRGVESHGMLLAAEDGATISLLQPDREIKNGAKIR